MVAALAARATPACFFSRLRTPAVLPWMRVTLARGMARRLFFFRVSTWRWVRLFIGFYQNLEGQRPREGHVCRPPLGDPPLRSKRFNGEGPRGVLREPQSLLYDLCRCDEVRRSCQCPASQATPKKLGAMTPPAHRKADVTLAI